MAGIPGSVTVTGLIAPTDTTDTYAVIDPLYGIDGLRSVADHAARNAITSPRRRPGMLVYTQNDALYWQLLPIPWNNTDTDWTQLVLGSSGSQGPQGNPGNQGVMGYQGLSGTQGAASTVPGPQGNQGAGFQGPQGADSTVPGPQGNQGLRGYQGSRGIPGGLYPTYVYTQSTTASTWMIHHDLGKYPSVTIFDDTNTEILGNIVYLDTSSLTVDFSLPVSGMAYLN